MASVEERESVVLNGSGEKVNLHTTQLRQSTSDVSLQLPAADPELSPVDRDLPAMDHGKEAWLFLSSAVMLEALIWGFPSVYGVFQDYYTTHAPFAGSQSIAVVGTCAMGIMYLEMPVIYAINRAWPSMRRWMSVCGVCVMCLALGLGSFSTSVPQLIASQGVVYAIGGGFAWTPLLQYMPEWFDKRLSLAYGIVLAGSAFAGVVFPLLIEWLLSAYGYQTTLRICAILMFLLTAPMLLFFKPRLHASHYPRSNRWDISLSHCVSPVFLIAQAGNIIEALGYFIPFVYLPSHARLLGASHFLSGLTVILLNGAACVGCVGMGALMDRYHFSTGVLISSVGTIISVLCFWGCAYNLPMLYVFSILYGLFACSWPCTWSGIMKEVQIQGKVKDPGLIFATLAAGKGIGSIASGPLSEALIRGISWEHAAFAYGSGYGAAIVFTGATAFFGSCSFVARLSGWI